ncbi:cysteine desulfurase NifS [Halalkalibacillus sediminis]|uniref:Cysteine desulfurase NifS n=1 Tax=Halalkalibacillus sediminis TaxID=2018042 RepID=A0A2I0QY82_9BACI|nr:cysteine desulfurase family protein [Halalkalibacillus sediminis]PKR79292.1 cysteine desulfurase NifS [Halalkalibacillus sediminis]
MIYLDNSATTKPSEDVLSTFSRVATDFYANPSSIHQLGGKSEQLLLEAKKQVASLLEIKENEIVFTSGGTESNNLAIKGIAREHKQRGNHIITSQVEHPSVLEACRYLESDGFEVTYLKVDHQGKISLNELKEALREDTILVTIMHVNNEIGTIQPIEDIAELLKNYPKTFFHTDHVQGFGKVKLNYQHEGLDLITISGHKIHGLRGTGCLVKKSPVKLHSLFHGGSQEGQVRPGTENLAGAVSLAKAMRQALEKMSQVNRINELRKRLINELELHESITILSPEKGAPHILNFSVKNFKPEVLIHALGEENIYISTKSACSSKKNDVSHVLAACGHTDDQAATAVRVSMHIEQTEEDIDAFIKAINKILKKYENIMG